MFVTNHVLSGALIGQALKGRPVAAFVAGIGSHLVLDAMPHWGCDFDAPGRDGEVPRGRQAGRRARSGRHGGSALAADR